MTAHFRKTRGLHKLESMMLRPSMSFTLVTQRSLLDHCVLDCDERHDGDCHGGHKTVWAMPLQRGSAGAFEMQASPILGGLIL